jgi:hypothetical protein
MRKTTLAFVAAMTAAIVLGGCSGDKAEGLEGSFEMTAVVADGVSQPAEEYGYNAGLVFSQPDGDQPGAVAIVSDGEEMPGTYVVDGAAVTITATDGDAAETLGCTIDGDILTCLDGETSMIFTRAQAE